MLIYRIAGSILLTLCSVTGAYMLNKAEGACLEQIEGLLSWTRFLRTQIDCFSMPVCDALAICPDDILRKCCKDLSKRPTSVNDFCGDIKIDDPHARRSMEQFCRSIGKGYRAEQLLLCDDLCEQLEDRRRVIAEQLPLKKKRNSTLCVSGALALIILFF